MLVSTCCESGVQALRSSLDIVTSAVAVFSMNIDKIKDGVGDKVGLILRGVTMFATCLVIAFAFEWRITLVMIGLAPLSAVLMSLSSRK
uniref:ABC transmembrane type-1 domain-containing protein n=1 Tax=Parascaris equorum TaxID=6256 RepID=A0A914S606_PAREQ